MKPQPTTPQVLQHLLLVQHGTIGSDQHVIARVQPFKSSVVLLLQCAIENVRVDAQYLLCRHAISSPLHSRHNFFLSCLRDRGLDRVLVRFHRISVAQEDFYVLSRSGLTCWIVPSSALVKLFAAAALTPAALGS